MIKIGIVGYGNLGKGVESAVKQNEDMELVAVFTRRDPGSVQIQSKAAVCRYEDIKSYVGKIDVMINCGGSATDLPVTTPEIARLFSVIDSFDTHANIPTHFENTDAAAKAGGTVAIISVGWDPGLFSLSRLYMNAVLPDGREYTFWGRGVSQGHSDAIRRIDGVADARQYTVPVPEALEKVRAGLSPELSVREKHTRECYVVAKEGADLSEIERQIKSMPNYFADYDTTVHFVSAEELKQNHSGLPHGGTVIRTGVTGQNSAQKIEFSLSLDSNPEFTGSVLVAYARAAKRLSDAGEVGCKTVFDIAPLLLSAQPPEQLRKHLL